MFPEHETGRVGFGEVRIESRSKKEDKKPSMLPVLGGDCWIEGSKPPSEEERFPREKLALVHLFLVPLVFLCEMFPDETLPAWD
mmetsp:Transcript_37389/g.55053  ORF Transcript_37389/g.55053 Transcript_37389/m.55053 type:complete len:84 (-) Transcript_37389:306-557(-)